MHVGLHVSLMCSSRQAISPIDLYDNTDQVVNVRINQPLLCVLFSHERVVHKDVTLEVKAVFMFPLWITSIAVQPGTGATQVWDTPGVKLLFKRHVNDEENHETGSLTWTWRWESSASHHRSHATWWHRDRSHSSVCHRGCRVEKGREEARSLPAQETTFMFYRGRGSLSIRFSDASHLSWFWARGTFILVLSSRDRSMKADS